MKKFVLLSVLGILVLVAGCGGGGGGATPTSSTTRQLVAGNQVVYSAKGTITDGTDTIPVSGTLTMTLHSSNRIPLYSNRVFELVGEVDLVGNGVPVMYTTTGLLEQSTTGTLYDLGTSDAALLSASTPPVMFPSPASVGQSFSYTASYSDSTNYTTYINITSIENVAGYQAYKVHSVENGVVGDDWYVPDLGMPVKSTIVMMDGSARISITATMQSKNF